jgi:hypothetical protein
MVGFTKIVRTTNEREPGAEEDTLTRLTGRDFKLAIELARDD